MKALRKSYQHGRSWQTVHFWRSCLSLEEHIHGVHYNTLTQCSGDYSLIINIASWFPSQNFSQTVVDLQKAVECSGRHVMVCLEGRTIHETFVIRKLASLVLHVMDLCFGTEAKAKACVLEQRYQKLNWSKAGGHCVDMMIACLLEVFASQVPKKKSHFIGRQRNKQAVVEFFEAGNTGGIVR